VRRLAFHEALGVLNVGDLHPGGSFATEFLLDEIAKIYPRVVLEVGAGIGCTTARMIERGWKVVPIEPSDVLRRKLQRRVGIEASADPFEVFESDAAPFDAVIGESSFYGMDAATAVQKVRRLLRPGGLFASLDMVWTAKAEAKTAARIHDETKRVFGIPVAARHIVTWTDWQATLRAAGFEEVEARRLPAGSLRSDGKTRRTILASAARHPLAFLQHLNHRLQARTPRVPPGWTETWMAVWRRA